MSRPVACLGMPRGLAIVGLLLPLALGCKEQVLLPSSLSTSPAQDSGIASNDVCELQFRSLPVSRDVPKLIIALDVSMAKADGSLLAIAQKSLSDLLPSYEGAIQFGYEPFPARTCPDGTCCASMDLRIKPISQTASDIQRELTCDVSGACRLDSDDSPSYSALLACRKYYEAEASSVSRFVLLLTDHDPLCAGEQSGCEEAEAETSRLAVMGIKTIVVGLGAGSDHTDCLIGILKRGLWSTAKRPPFVSDTATLKPLLKTVFDAVAGHQCQLALKSKPASKDQVVVTFDDNPVPRDPKRINGWEFDSDSDTRITIFGSYCSQLTDSQVSKVEAGIICSLCAGPDACQ